MKNPVIFCCNLVSVDGDNVDNDVGLSFNLSVGNKNIATLHSDLILSRDDSLRCVATTNVSLGNDFLEKNGDIVFNVRYGDYINFSKILDSWKIQNCNEANQFSGQFLLALMFQNIHLRCVNQ